MNKIWDSEKKQWVEIIPQPIAFDFYGEPLFNHDKVIDKDGIIWRVMVESNNTANRNYAYGHNGYTVFISTYGQRATCNQIKEKQFKKCD